MTRRTKLELEINKPVEVELLYDEPVSGTSTYGSYNMYAVKDDTGMEWSFFAPEEVHKELSKLSKGDIAVITKIAAQKGSRVITKYDVQLPNKVKKTNSSVHIGEVLEQILPENGADSKDAFYEIMKSSYADALSINTELNGRVVSVEKIAVTLFIARSKQIS